MRRVILGTSVFLLGACATVSMTPGEQTVTTEVTATQTALRTASDAYCDNTEDKGWVAKTASLFGMARILMNGDAGEKTDAAPDYASQIGAGTETPSIVFAQIAEDAGSAKSGLVIVNREARALLVDGDENSANRTDVMSFERALVNAQKSYRSFAQAADVASQDGTKAPVEIDAALAEFASEIDAARKTANDLADRYASLTRTVS
ncbi:MAG: hypothetical protein V3V03_09555 [Hyphomonadaceae bacterium]